MAFGKTLIMRYIQRGGAKRSKRQEWLDEIGGVVPRDRSLNGKARIRARRAGRRAARHG